MFGLLKNLLRSGENTKENQVRRLSHPNDLRQGDIIKFSYLPQSDLSNTPFEVTQVNTYLYGDLCYPELVLKDRTGNLLYMMVEDDDGDEFLAVSKKIQKTQIDQIIDADAMTRILATGTGTLVKVLSIPDGFKEWMKGRYREVDDSVRGAFVKGDARYLSDEALNRREKFTAHILEDESEEFALEIEFYETGETELCATVYYDIDQIEEMWPAQTPQ